MPVTYKLSVFFQVKMAVTVRKKVMDTVLATSSLGRNIVEVTTPPVTMLSPEAKRP